MNKTTTQHGDFIIDYFWDGVPRVVIKHKKHLAKYMTFKELFDLLKKGDTAGDPFEVVYWGIEEYLEGKGITAKSIRAIEKIGKFKDFLEI